LKHILNIYQLLIIVNNRDDITMSADDDTDNKYQHQDDDIGNPFIIKKRKLLPVPTVRSICIFKKPMQMDFFYAFIETICGPPIESTKIMHILKSGCVTVAKVNTKSNPKYIGSVPESASASASAAEAASEAVAAAESEYASAFYMVDIFAFKRGIYMNAIRPFMDTVASQYYRPTHAFYAERSMTGPSAFTQFIQVIRHISKHANLKVVSTVKYEQSISSKVYYVEYKRLLPLFT
jgi:hypothetical protein